MNHAGEDDKRGAMMVDYVVIRPGVGLPHGFLPPDLEGKWFDMASLPLRNDLSEFARAVAVPSGRFEVRDDGAVAEVFEVRP